MFVTKIEDGEKKTEGLCLQCARELGVPVDDIMGDQLKKFGISPEESLPATQVLHLKALSMGADILRVHDVAEAVRTRELYKTLFM